MNLVLLIIPVMLVISLYAILKVIQTPAKPRHVLSTREHRELFEAAFIAPKRIKPFPPDTHHEQETNYTTTKS